MTIEIYYIDIKVDVFGVTCLLMFSDLWTVSENC